MQWRQTCPPHGDVPPPKNHRLHYGTMYWFHSHVISRANHICLYKLCWIDIENNKWGFQFIPHSNPTISIILASHRNEILCFINDGRTIVWSIEETTNQIDSIISKNSLRISGWVDDGLRWSFMSNVTSDINTNAMDIFMLQQLIITCSCANTIVVILSSMT